MDIEHAADTLWAGIRRKQHLPVEWRGRLTFAQAYAVQLAILDRTLSTGEVQAGWKVGLTSAAMRAQQGIAEPCFGFLLRSGHLRSGARVAHGDLIAPGIENELCLTIGEPLRGPGITFDQARRAIAFVEPALEIAEVRGDFSADFPLSIADNVQQRAFVTGEASSYDTRHPLEQTTVAVAFNGVPLATATGAEVMGSPVHAIAWLANKLAEHGRSLEAGMRVMSGSFTRQFAVAAGDAVSSTFEPFGRVDVFFD
jgi:2-keto-4-pentenoate hydratase